MTVKTETRATAWPRPHVEPVTKARSTLNTDASAIHKLLSVGRLIELRAGDHAIGDLAMAGAVDGLGAGFHGDRGRARGRKEADDRQAVLQHVREGGGRKGVGEQEALPEHAADLAQRVQLALVLDALGDGLEA